MARDTYLKGWFHPEKMIELTQPLPPKFKSDTMDNTVYSSLQPPEIHLDYGSVRSSVDIEVADSEESKESFQGSHFSWSEYCSFFMIGMSMMWTWSMILQAVPYFQQRFKSNEWILRYFQSFNLVVFAPTILATTIFLMRSKTGVVYERRLRTSLLGYIVVASLLTTSTIGALAVDAEIYFPCLLLMVFASAIANALSQNAAFAFASGFGRTEYIPAIMTGEALAALLPSVVEIASALLFPSSYFDSNDTDDHQTSLPTLIYFFLGVIFGIMSLGSLMFLEHQRRNRGSLCHRGIHHSHCSLQDLWGKLYLPACANFLCLTISTMSPVFSSKILSLVPEDAAPTLLRPEAFIPLAIVLWNVGDVLGSMLALFSESLTRRPYLLFFFSLIRIGFIPLYFLCNIDGKGSIAGDWFYLIVVQFMVGLTQGWLSGTSMMGVPNWVEVEEREAAGAFMGMSLVAGLVGGSFLGLVVA